MNKKLVLTPNWSLQWGRFRPKNHPLSTVVTYEMPRKSEKRWLGTQFDLYFNPNSTPFYQFNWYSCFIASCIFDFSYFFKWNSTHLKRKILIKNCQNCGSPILQHRGISNWVSRFHVTFFQYEFPTLIVRWQKLVSSKNGCKNYRLQIFLLGT